MSGLARKLGLEANDHRRHEQASAEEGMEHVSYNNTHINLYGRCTNAPEATVIQNEIFSAVPPPMTVAAARRRGDPPAEVSTRTRPHSHHQAGARPHEEEGRTPKLRGWPYVSWYV